MINRRYLCLLCALVALFFIATTYHWGGERITRLARPPAPVLPPGPQTVASKTHDYVVQDGKTLSAANITLYLDTIFGRDVHDFDLMDCRPINNERYKSLKERQFRSPIPFYFALNLHNNRDMLPQLMSSIVKVMRYFGPGKAALSIVEGLSDDGTYDVLDAMREELKGEGFYYHAESSDINPNNGGRIEGLSKLRNLALVPLLEDHKSFAGDATIAFINDVTACPNDLLELLLQRQNLDATMTCGMDWNYRDGKNVPTFYDVWVSRAVNGDSFFFIPKDGSWAKSGSLFWNEPVASKRLEEFRPFQVYSCWGGATTISARPFLEGVAFRSADRDRGECYQGEPQTLAKDFWLRGIGKVAVIPTVNFAYDIKSGKRLKKFKGYTEDKTSRQTLNDDKITWQTQPPNSTLCQDGWDNQMFQPWNLGWENATIEDFRTGSSGSS